MKNNKKEKTLKETFDELPFAICDLMSLVLPAYNSCMLGSMMNSVLLGALAFLGLFAMQVMMIANCIPEASSVNDLDKDEYKNVSFKPVKNFLYINIILMVFLEFQTH